MRRSLYSFLKMNIKETKLNYSVVYPGRVSPQIHYKSIPGIIACGFFCQPDFGITAILSTPHFSKGIPDGRFFLHEENDYPFIIVGGFALFHPPKKFVYWIPPP